MLFNQQEISNIFLNHIGKLDLG